MHLAQVNIAKMKAPIDSPVMTDFVNNLDQINELAESSEGFVWRLKNDITSEASTISYFGDNFLIVNMSVWENIFCLKNFVYQSGHLEVFKRKQEWFKKMKDMHMANWYIKQFKVPSVEEAAERLDYLRKFGETPYAFTFKSQFSIEDLRNYLSAPENLEPQSVSG